MSGNSQIPAYSPPFSKKEALAYGWHAALDNIILLATAVAIAFIASLVFNYIESSAKTGGMDATVVALNIASIVISVLIELGFVHVALMIARGEQIEWRAFFRPARFFFSYLIASTLFTIVVAVGIVLFIVPGVIWALMFALYAYALVDEDLGPIAAMKRSALLTRGVRLELFLFFLLVIGVNILGALTLGVGLVITIPATMIATARVYYTLHNRLIPATTEEGAQVPVVVNNQ